MLKTLFIATSALALTAGVASAQTASNNGFLAGGPNGVRNVELSDTRNADTTSGINAAGFRSGLRDASATGRRQDNIGDNLPQARAILNNVDQELGAQGSGSLEDLRSTSSGNKGVVDQDGNSNAAGINQNDTNGSFAVINSNGNDNLAEITQSEQLGGSTAPSANRAFVGQLSSQGATSDNTQIARITQVSSFPNSSVNDAVIQQGGIRAGVNERGVNNFATISQRGAGNQATAIQGRSGNVATIEQAGGNHRAISRSADTNQTSRIIQGGSSDNQAYVNQEGVAGDEATGAGSRIDQFNGVTNSIAAVSQAGAFTVSLITQRSGDGHEAYVEQTLMSDASRSQIDQTGTSQFASIFQNANAGESEVLQSGNNNATFVFQNAAANSNAYSSQNGTNNSAVISQ